jgi:predicted peptidase
MKKTPPARFAAPSARHNLTLLLASLLALSLPMKKAFAQDGPLQAKSFATTLSHAVKASYLLYLPKDYASQPEARWPLILFLHGAGERGSDLKKVAVHGPPKLIQAGRAFPFIVVSPQCPDNQRWEENVVLGLLDEVIAQYRVDTNRVYLTGLSMGGFGSWSVGAKNPERFAALAPICGGGEVIDLYLAPAAKQKALRSLGVWAFHGAKDPVVPLAESERMMAALKRAGCTDTKLTVYPDAGHDAWTETYNNPELYEWFLKHDRSAKTTPSTTKSASSK